MQLISSYFLNQKVAGYFLLYKGRGMAEGLTTRQPAREAETDKRDHLNLQQKGSQERF